MTRKPLSNAAARLLTLLAMADEVEHEETVYLEGQRKRLAAMGKHMRELADDPTTGSAMKVAGAGAVLGAWRRTPRGDA